MRQRRGHVLTVFAVGVAVALLTVALFRIREPFIPISGPAGARPRRSHWRPHAPVSRTFAVIEWMTYGTLRGTARDDCNSLSGACDKTVLPTVVPTAIPTVTPTITWTPTTVPITSLAPTVTATVTPTVTPTVIQVLPAPAPIKDGTAKEFWTNAGKVSNARVIATGFPTKPVAPGATFTVEFKILYFDGVADGVDHSIKSSPGYAPDIQIAVLFDSNLLNLASHRDMNGNSTNSNTWYYQPHGDHDLINIVFTHFASDSGDTAVQTTWRANPDVGAGTYGDAMQIGGAVQRTGGSLMKVAGANRDAAHPDNYENASLSGWFVPQLFEPASEYRSATRSARLVVK